LKADPAADWSVPGTAESRSVNEIISLNNETCRSNSVFWCRTLVRYWEVSVLSPSLSYSSTCVNSDFVPSLRAHRASLGEGVLLCLANCNIHTTFADKMSSIFTNPNPFGAQPATSSNPFGGLNATASQPAQGSNLFGQSQNQTGGGFLGANEQTQQRPLFGASQPQPQQTSFFGQSIQQQQPPANNLFGAKASTNPFGGFGGSTMQQTQQQQQQNLFGQTAQQQQQQQAQQAQLQTQLQASQPPRLASSIWQPNSGVNACKYPRPLLPYHD
jgi:hypothetical protein